MIMSTTTDTRTVLITDSATTFTVRLRYMAATMAVPSAPSAAASVGVATPRKMTPRTMKTMRLKGAR